MGQGVGDIFVVVGGGGGVVFVVVAAADDDDRLDSMLGRDVANNTPV